MYGEAGALIGSGAGGLLGQVGDVLSAPRKAAWSMLGMPEDGNQLLAQTFGMDPDAMLTRALGMGAEVALDPLTYLGMGLGSVGGKVFGKAAGAASGVAREVEALQAAKAAAYSGLQGRAAGEAATIQGQLARVPGLATQDVPGIAGGMTKPAALAHKGAYDELAAAGFARPNAGPMPMGHPSPVPGLEVLGRQLPPGFKSVPMKGTVAGRQIGSGVGRVGDDALPAILPDEVALMQEMAAARPGGALGMDPAVFLEDFARSNANAMNAATPMPTLGQHWGGNMPRGWSEALGDVTSMEVPQAYDAITKMLTSAQARQRGLEFGLGDYASVGGSAFAGGLAGDQMMRGRNG